jgi:hypothetical protein
MLVFWVEDWGTMFFRSVGIYLGVHKELHNPEDHQQLRHHRREKLKSHKITYSSFQENEILQKLPLPTF